MGRLFARGALSLFLTLACAGGAVVVSAAADATERDSSVAVSEEREVVVVPVDAAPCRVGKVATNSVGRGETLRQQWPAAVAPACREFEAKCAAKTATRGDLIALKKFIAASAIDPAAKTNVTRQVRKIYQESKKK